MKQNDFLSIADVFSGKKDAKTKKAPAHQWQDLALRVIKELNVPGFKRNSVFKVCKDNPSNFIETCLSDTKELCKTGSKWSYFFKLVSLKNAPDKTIK